MPQDTALYVYLGDLDFQPSKNDFSAGVSSSFLVFSILPSFLLMHFLFLVLSFCRI